MKAIDNNYPSIEQVVGNINNLNSARKAPDVQGASFADIFKQKQITDISASDVKFSKHAALRLDNRNIELSSEQLLRLNEGAQKANAKGINESLVLVDELAFIVNIKNNTVITAMDQNEARENVFTNIDGAVIA